MNRATIHDVARAAGVAIKTVSRVVNDEPNVAEKTRARVQAAVEALNYHPSLSARSLAGRRSYLIGLVYENPSTNYIMDVLHGATERCQEERFRLFAHQCSGKGPELVREVLGLIDQSHLDGLIVSAPLSQSVDLIKAVDKRKVAFVRIAPDGTHHPSSFVDMDDEGAAREMTEHLIGLGHTRIGFIIGHPAHYASGLRLRGFKAALKKHRIPHSAAFVKQGYFTFESGSQCSRELLAMNRPPTAIFASNDDMAAGALQVAHSLGLVVPRDLSIAGFDDTYVSRIVWPPLTTVHQPSYNLAYAAADLLLQKLGNANAPPSARLPHRIVLRDSTGTAPGA